MERTTEAGKAHGRAATEDPLTAEPYCWADCTVSISITLLPQEAGEAHERVALVGVRTHADAPLIRRWPASQVLPLPPALTQLLEELQAQLPARAAHSEERRTHAAAATPTPGLVVGAGPPGQTRRRLRAAAAIASAAPTDWDDDLFSTPPAASAPDGTAATPSPAAAAKSGDLWVEAAEAAPPPAQLSLI